MQRFAIGDVLTFCFEHPDLKVAMAIDINNALD
jgi:hypothetical protein